MDCSLVTVRHIVGGYAARLHASTALASLSCSHCQSIQAHRFANDFCHFQDFVESQDLLAFTFTEIRGRMFFFCKNIAISF